MVTVRNGLVRIARAWRALDAEQRQAALAAVALLLTMFLPWYEKNVAVGNELASDTVSAFGAVSFIEAAIFLSVLGVLCCCSSAPSSGRSTCRAVTGR